MTIKQLKNEEVKLTGKHGIARQKAIIHNEKITIRIAKARIQKSKAHITIMELKEAKRALGTNSNDKLINALKQVRNISNNQ